jgi:hypothetical protein
MIDLDLALGEQLLDISIRKTEPQVPAHREDNHLGWEPEALERRRRYLGALARAVVIIAHSRPDGERVRIRVPRAY